MGGSEVDPDDDVTTPGPTWREMPLWAQLCSVLPFVLIGTGILLYVLE